EPGGAEERVIALDAVSGRGAETDPLAAAVAEREPGERVLGLVVAPLAVARDRPRALVVADAKPARVSAEDGERAATLDPSLDGAAALARPVLVVTERAQHRVAVEQRGIALQVEVGAEVDVDALAREPVQRVQVPVRERLPRAGAVVDVDVDFVPRMSAGAAAGAEQRHRARPAVEALAFAFAQRSVDVRDVVGVIGEQRKV